ncbi:MAG TPA: hypothetical protein VH539_22625 [Gemmatimonadaceae bacterium]
MRRGTSAPSFRRNTTTANATKPRSKYSLITGLIEIRILPSRAERAVAGMNSDRTLSPPSGLWDKGMHVNDRD